MTTRGLSTPGTPLHCSARPDRYWRNSYRDRKQHFIHFCISIQNLSDRQSQSWIDKPFKLNTESACVCYVPCWTCGPHWRWQWRAASEVGLPAATGVETTDWPGRSFPSRWGRTRWRACAPSAGRRSAAASASGSGCRKQGSPHSHCSHLGAHKHTHTHTHKHTHRSGYLSISKLHKLYWNHF